MHRWLRYFFSKDAVYYAPCILLGPKNSKEKSFSIRLPGDWKNLSSLTARHLKDDSPHYDNIKAARRFTAGFFVSSKEKKTFVNKLSRLMMINRKKLRIHF